MKATVVIKRKTEKIINTKYGKKKKYSLLCPGKEGDQWISVWSSAEADSWSEGDEVIMNITSREYNGKTYYDGKPIVPNYAKMQVELLEQILNVLNNGNVTVPAPEISEPVSTGEMLPEIEEPPIDDTGVPF